MIRSYLSREHKPLWFCCCLQHGALIIKYRADRRCSGLNLFKQETAESSRVSTHRPLRFTLSGLAPRTETTHTRQHQSLPSNKAPLTWHPLTLMPEKKRQTGRQAEASRTSSASSGTGGKHDAVWKMRRDMRAHHPYVSDKIHIPHKTSA